jgi:flagellar biosynthesis protein
MIGETAGQLQSGSAETFGMAQSEDGGQESGPGPRTDAVAVALEYRPGDHAAPTVVASGRGALAENILALAFANGVRVREDADLAELLSAVDVGEDIPVEAFLAVAEVLAYVYRANREDPGPLDFAAAGGRP